MQKLFINSLGLASNIVGALIFAHGLLLSDQDIKRFSGGVTCGGWVSGLRDLLRQNKKEAQIGVGLIVAGFALQFISQFL